MSSIQSIREQAQQVIAAKIAAAKEAAETALLTNEKFQDAMVAQAIREESTNKLASLSDLCEEIVSSNPIFSKALKQNRTWNPSRRYGFGNQFAALTGLLSGIQYSASEHNMLMLAATGLNADLIERTLDAAGTLPYYNPRHNTVVEGKPTNAAELIECVQLLELSLGVTIDKSSITQAIADRQYTIAQVKAEAAFAEAQAAEALGNMIIR